MPPKRKTRQTLKKGDNMVVTIEEALNDCVIVSMIFQSRKFCGALMDTTKRNGPYGIPTSPEQEDKMETCQTSEVSKPNYKTPFPAPLLTRKSYKQDVPQPPQRNIFRRIRRSRRKARLNMARPSKDGSTKQRGWKFLSHSDTCQCCECTQGFHDTKSEPSSSKNIKRKATKDAVAIDENVKRVKFQDDTPSTSSDDEGAEGVILPEKLASPLKNLIPRKAQTFKPKLQPSKLQRSPIIKITYKSPGGRGRVIKIPSKPHNSPVKDELGQPLAPAGSSTANAGSDDLPLLDSSLLLDEKPDAVTNAGTINQLRETLPQKSKRQYKRKNATLNSKLLPKNKILSKNDNASSVLSNEHESVVEVKGVVTQKKQNNKAYRKQAQAMKVLKRAKKATFVIPYEKVTEHSLPDESFKLLPRSANDKHLRVILKPLDEKNGFVMENKPKETDDYTYNSYSIDKNGGASCSQNAAQLEDKKFKKAAVPQSHTIFVSTCKNHKGIIFTQGDVVWSKLTGYPWWPSRIVKLIVTKTDGEILKQQAKVGWFRSRSTSTIPLHCVQSFEKYFDVRFQKKRKGLYLKAVNDAKNAVKEISPEVRKLISQFET